MHRLVQLDKSGGDSLASVSIHHGQKVGSFELGLQLSEHGEKLRPLWWLPRFHASIVPHFALRGENAALRAESVSCLKNWWGERRDGGQGRGHAPTGKNEMVDKPVQVDRSMHIDIDNR